MSADEDIELELLLAREELEELEEEVRMCEDRIEDAENDRDEAEYSVRECRRKIEDLEQRISLLPKTGLNVFAETADSKDEHQMQLL